MTTPYWKVNHLQFFIQNYDNIELLKELSEQARRELPARVGSYLEGLIRSAIRQDAFAGMNDIQFQESEYNLWWASDVIYDAGSDAGLYFGLYPLNDKALLNGDEGNGPFLYLHCDSPRRRSSPMDLGSVKKSLAAQRKELAREGIRLDFTCEWDWETYLCAKPAGELLSIAALQDHERFGADLLNAARAFTERVVSALSSA